MKSRMVRLALVLLAILVGLTTVQCTQPTAPVEEIAPTEEIPPAVETIPPALDSDVPVTYVSYWRGSPWISVDNELVERFQEAYPYIEVDRKLYARLGETYLTDSIPPDVMAWDGAFLYPLAEKQWLFMDIGHVWKQEGWEEVIPDGIQALSQSSGRYYHLPTHYFWIAFYYNKAVFEQYGLVPPETWNEFLGVCATLKEAGVTPISIGMSESEGAGSALLWFEYLNIRINGLGFRDELMLEGQVPFNDSRVREVFATLQALLEEGYFNEDYAHLGESLSYFSVLNGEAAIVLAPNFYLLDTMSESRWDELDFFRFPVIDPDVPVAETPGIEGFVIPASAPDPQAATEFLIYRGSAEAQSYWAENCGPLGGVPVRSDVDPAVLTPAMQKAGEMIENADELGQIIFWLDSPMVEPMMDRFPSWFDDPGTLDEMLDELETTRQEVFEE